jgi:hypothetical protein
MGLNHFAAHGQADSRSWNVLAVQALERGEDQTPVPLVDADAIVINADDPIDIVSSGTDLNPRRDAVPPVLQGIGEEILKYVPQLRFIASYQGQFIGMDLRASVSDELTKVLNGPIQNDT